MACRVGGFEIIELVLNHRPNRARWLIRAKESALLIACSRGHSQVAFKLANTLPSLAWDQSGSLACLLMAASEGDTGEFNLSSGCLGKGSHLNVSLFPGKGTNIV